jgi:hypothetical protein
MRKAVWLFCCVAAGCCELTNSFGISLYAEGQSHLSGRMLRKEIRAAHTPEQYRALAKYFRAEQRDFQTKALAEQKELSRLKDKPTSFSSKYPTSLDAANHLYQYHLLKSDEMGRRALEFEQKVQSQSETSAAAAK